MSRLDGVNELHFSIMSLFKLLTTTSTAHITLIVTRFIALLIHHVTTTVHSLRRPPDYCGFHLRCAMAQRASKTNSLNLRLRINALLYSYTVVSNICV